MRKIFLIILVLAAVVGGCKKYEEGPCISFRSVEKRICRTRIIKNYLVDGVDSLSLFNTKLGPKFCFSKDEEHSFLIIYRNNYAAYDTNDAIGYTWNLNKEKDKITIRAIYEKGGIAPLIRGINSEWEILRLTMKDFKMKTTYNNKEYVIELE